MCHEKEDLMTTRKTDKYANRKIPESILPPRDDLDLSHSFVHHLNLVTRQHRQYHLFVDVLLSLATPLLAMMSAMMILASFTIIPASCIGHLNSDRISIKSLNITTFKR